MEYLLTPCMCKIIFVLSSSSFKLLGLVPISKREFWCSAVSTNSLHFSNFLTDHKFKKTCCFPACSRLEGLPRTQQPYK